MANDLKGQVSSVSSQDLVVIGIHTGGVWLANELKKRLNHPDKVYSININFYRDDFSRAGINPNVGPSNLPVSLTDKTVVLVDDVIYTGRTIRAALNEIFDYGRPAKVLLAVLADRGGRELPFAADVLGTHVTLTKDQQIKLNGPEPLTLELVQ